MSKIHVLDFLTSFEGRTFGRNGNLSASIGNMNHFQLFNPVGSNVRALIYQLRMGSDTSVTYMSLSHHNTALGTLVGAGVNFANPGTPAGKVELRTSQTAAALGTAILANMVIGTNLELVLGNWWTTLMPGQGLVTFNGGLNQATYFNGIWIEVPL